MTTFERTGETVFQTLHNTIRNYYADKEILFTDEAVRMMADRLAPPFERMEQEARRIVESTNAEVRMMKASNEAMEHEISRLVKSRNKWKRRAKHEEGRRRLEEVTRGFLALSEVFDFKALFEGLFDMVESHLGPTIESATKDAAEGRSKAVRIMCPKCSHDCLYLRMESGVYECHACGAKMDADGGAVISDSDKH